LWTRRPARAGVEELKKEPERAAWAANAVENINYLPFQEICRFNELNAPNRRAFLGFTFFLQGISHLAFPTGV
jgi:hypothetical protein